VEPQERGAATRTRKQHHHIDMVDGIARIQAMLADSAKQIGEARMTTGGRIDP
jgi:hypothetical protein